MSRQVTGDKRENFLEPFEYKRGLSFYGYSCGTGYYTGCDTPSSGPISESGAWCSYGGAPYYQTGAVCSSNFSNNGADGVYGTGDDIYSTNCYYSQPYTKYYDCNGDCY